MKSFFKSILLACIVLPFAFGDLAMGQLFRRTAPWQEGPGRNQRIEAEPQPPQAQPQQNTSGQRFVDLQVRGEGNVSAAFSPDGKKIITLANGQIQIWDAESGKLLQTLRKSFSHSSLVALSSDGKIFTNGIPGQGRLTSFDYTIWNADTERELTSWTISNKHVKSARFSSDGKRIVTVLSAHNDNTVTIWDAGSGKELRTLSYPNAARFGGLQVAEFSPDGKKVVTTSISGEGNVGRVWDTETGNVLGTLTANNNVSQGNSFSLPTTSFSPNEKKFAIHNSQDGTIVVGETGTGKVLATLTQRSQRRDYTFQLGTAEFSSDGKKLAVTGCFVK